MKIGLLWKSNKENEHRYPLHWEHIAELNISERRQLYFEKEYPSLTDNNLDLNFLTRDDIFEKCDLIILPKPEVMDYPYFRPNQILWGWMHAVQGYSLTDLAIDKKLTLLSWENMYTWSNGSKQNHVFARNNEIAGYAAVNHFMQLKGITPGVYGKDLKVAVLGFGSTAKGAINALMGLGGNDITVFSKRNKFQIVDAIKNVKYKTYTVNNDNKIYLDGVQSEKKLLEYDLIVNCVLQNPNRPMIFLRENDIVDKKMYIIDISCDKGMGFDFSTPTSFNNPIIETKKYSYYSVDHTPTYYWNSASYEISGALLPFLRYIIHNKTFKGNLVLENAVDIENGIIKNISIIEFQNRETEYPHKQINL